MVGRAAWPSGDGTRTHNPTQSTVQGSRCKRPNHSAIRPPCLFLFDGCFMKWPKYLIFALACNFGHVFALFWFWGQTCDKPQYATRFLYRSYKRRSTKSCPQVHAYWPYVIFGSDLYLLDKQRNFCAWAGTTRNTTRAEITLFWWTRYNPIYWVIQKCCVNVFLTQVVWVILT